MVDFIYMTISFHFFPGDHDLQKRHEIDHFYQYTPIVKTTQNAVYKGLVEKLPALTQQRQHHGCGERE